jgi:hypothetical protein
MTQIQAYDRAAGWQMSPFEGRKDAELLGEGDLREYLGAYTATSMAMRDGPPILK